MTTRTHPSMQELGTVYRMGREALSARLRALPAQDLDRLVPATPAWRIRDVAAHLCGAAADLVQGRIDDIGSEAWTNAHVTSRSGTQIDEVLDQWDGHARGLESATFRPRTSGLLHTITTRTDELGWDWRSLVLSDMVIHAQDVSCALEVPVDRHAPGSAEACQFFVHVALHLLVVFAGLPALRIRTDTLDTVVGSGSPAACVRCDDYELTRAIAGRRTAEQIATFDWDTDPAPYIAVFTPYALRTTPLMER